MPTRLERTRGSLAQHTVFVHEKMTWRARPEATQNTRATHSARLCSRKAIASYVLVEPVARTDSRTSDTFKRNKNSNFNFCTASATGDMKTLQLQSTARRPPLWFWQPRPGICVWEAVQTRIGMTKLCLLREYCCSWQAIIAQQENSFVAYLRI